MATIQELEQAGARALAANNREAAQYFANEIKSLRSVGLNAQEEIEQEPEGFVEKSPTVRERATMLKAMTQEERDEYFTTGEGRDLDVIREIQAPGGLVNKAIFYADDFNNQFNRSIATLAGAP